MVAVGGCEHSESVDFKRHTGSHGPPSKYGRLYEIEYTGKVFSNLEDDDTPKRSEEVQYRCKICNTKTTLQNNMIRHVRIQHGTGFICPDPSCAKKINRKDNLKTHIKSKHPNTADSLLKDDIFN